jgi:GNAT superfamily N-acetyltransferase
MAKDDRAVMISVEPLTTERWMDFEALFDSAAIPGRCWCMWWRGTQREALANAGEGNKKRMQQKVIAGERVGLLAYVGAEPVGWCSAGPRELFGRITRSPALTPVDGREPPQGTWSTVCYFVHRKYRRRRVAHELLRAAVRFAREQGATAFEGYPVRPRETRLDNNSAFPGTHGMYVDAGFTEVPSRAPDRSIQMIMRRSLR